MTTKFVRPQSLVIVVSIQFIEICAHNIQQISDTNNNTDVILKTITSEDYPNKDRLDVESIPNLEPTTVAPSLDTWSVALYVASFGGLILFFLIVSCSEWCCRRNAHRRCQRNNDSQTGPQIVAETPPPSYDLFAPPAYKDLLGASNEGRGCEKREYDVYVVPVCALDTLMENVQSQEAPPCYHSANSTQYHPAELPLSCGTTVNDSIRIT